MAIRLIPPALMAEFRQEAAGRDRPVSRSGPVFIALVWLGCLALLGWWVYGRIVS